MGIGIVGSYKYQEVHLNNKLDWTDHTAASYKEGQNRLHLLRKLRSFGVQGVLQTTFYDSVVASTIFYGEVCWSSSISAAGRERLGLSRPAPSWDALLTQCRWWEREIWWISCHLCWWRSPTPCRSLSQHWAAPSAIDWYIKLCDGEVLQVLPSCCRHTRGARANP